MTKGCKAAMLSAAMASVVTIAAYAAEPTSQPQTQNPPQVAANPGVPNVNAGPPGHGNGHWAWIPANPSPQTASGATGIRTDDGQAYSKKGFGTAPN